MTMPRPEQMENLGEQLAHGSISTAVGSIRVAFVLRLLRCCVHEEPYEP